MVLTVAHGGIRVTGLVLSHVLRHYLVVETERVLVRQVVVKFTALWLDDIGLAGG